MNAAASTIRYCERDFNFQHCMGVRVGFLQNQQDLWPFTNPAPWLSLLQQISFYPN